MSRVTHCEPGLPMLSSENVKLKFKEARKGFFVDVVFAKRLKITKKDI